MTEVVLETPRLLLRRIGPGDAQRQFDLLNSPDVMALLGGPRTLEQIIERDAQTNAQFDRDGFGFMLVEERDSGDLVGRCGLKRIDNPLAHNHGDHEIGWLIRPDRWRRGYAHEAASAVLDWAFGPIGAPFVVALTGPQNEASWALMERLGMVRAPECDFDDPDYPPEDNPTIAYRIMRADWLEQRS